MNSSFYYFNVLTFTLIFFYFILRNNDNNDNDDNDNTGKINRDDTMKFIADKNDLWWDPDKNGSTMMMIKKNDGGDGDGDDDILKKGFFLIVPGYYLHLHFSLFYCHVFQKKIKKFFPPFFFQILETSNCQ